MTARNKLDQIQALRGIAAILVVLSHIKFIGKGAFDVDIFFCISGFIMMHVTQSSTKDFIKKRLIRITPIYWSLTLLVFAIATVKPSLFHSAEASPEFLIRYLGNKN